MGQQQVDKTSGNILTDFLIALRNSDISAMLLVPNCACWLLASDSRNGIDLSINLYLSSSLSNQLLCKYNFCEALPSSQVSSINSLLFSQIKLSLLSLSHYSNSLCSLFFHTNIPIPRKAYLSLSCSLANIPMLALNLSASRYFLHKKVPFQVPTIIFFFVIIMNSLYAKNFSLNTNHLSVGR